jgi:hypothetical protein
MPFLPMMMRPDAAGIIENAGAIATRDTPITGLRRLYQRDNRSDNRIITLGCFGNVSN